MAVTVAHITSNALKRADWWGREPGTANAPPPVSYEDEGNGSLGLSVGSLLVTEFLFGDRPVSTPSEILEQTDSMSAAIERDFARMVTEIREVERVFIRKDEDFMRIWTVIHDVDVEVEDRIYEAQMTFMDKFRDFPCDFSVIFRQDLDRTALKPLNAQVLFSR